MHGYSLAIDQVVQLLGNNHGRMDMTTVYYKLGRLSESVDVEELAYRLAKIEGYPSRSRTEMRPRQQGHGAHGTAELAKSGKSGMSRARPRSFMANQKRVIP